MNGMQTVWRGAVWSLLVVVAHASFASAQASSAGMTDARTTLNRVHRDARPARPEVELQLYFTNPNLPEWANTCGAGEFVKRRVAATKRPADTALRLLFAGPTAEEKAKGMESLAPLGDYYLGVSIKKGVAVVNFRSGAEEYLHVSGAACQQEQVLTPIVETLKRFGTIKSVDYAINGKIIEEWDA